MTDHDPDPRTRCRGIRPDPAGGGPQTPPAGPTGGRVRLSRRAGWRKPPGAVVVARPTRWGNPFDWRRLGRAEAVRRHRLWLLAHPDLLVQVRAELAGRVLACWCPLDEPCHADTLADLAGPPGHAHPPEPLAGPQGDPEPAERAIQAHTEVGS